MCKERNSSLWVPMKVLEWEHSLSSTWLSGSKKILRSYELGEGKNNPSQIVIKHRIRK